MSGHEGDEERESRRHLTSSVGCTAKSQRRVRRDTPQG
jgi:hypothetical protein